ncbi:hypothetical protein GTA62_14645 [Roseobacter sp. HKCCD9010]|uniref:hypothetical protein n=1 Tax=unclassified Roseobacter TaxID=196798 RepID=UPI001490BD76|nr:MULTISPECIES: hypothetical protein [unclassified Roseobacter]MBF9050651.1 hypothetical protein [Rhodobacterales bacterium HKCCD4356]NNV11931.1 hypothetical protein [Roseobacter sp. HKCCD7357]NNV16944.1 hypothetical protein [Roseobacter sp. HKCCD8768]NNV26173.1 hypothetical protein [Roseobacter sp. HKCCD8192]NNV30668.1 hypothetical protein [Roseobacter sp. HKCCD9061]
MNSEDVKNWVQSIAIVLAGCWAFFEFVINAPNRDTTIAESEAALSPRVDALVTSEVFGLTRENFEAHRAATCSSDAETHALPLETRISYSATNSMTASTTISIERVVARRVGGTPNPITANQEQTALSTLWPAEVLDVSDENFLIGSRDRILEPGETNTFYFAGLVPFTFPCEPETAPGITEFAIGFEYKLVSQVGSRSGTGEHAAFVVCPVDVGLTRSCRPTVSPLPIDLPNDYSPATDGGSASTTNREVVATPGVRSENASTTDQMESTPTWRLLNPNALRSYNPSDLDAIMRNYCLSLPLPEQPSCLNFSDGSNEVPWSIPNAMIMDAPAPFDPAYPFFGPIDEGSVATNPSLNPELELYDG